MRFKQIIENSTTAGSVATVAQPMMTQTRESVDVKGLKPVKQLMRGTKKKGPYANSIVEGKVKELISDLKNLTSYDFEKKHKQSKADVRADMKKVNEDDLSEQDLIVIPGQGRLRKTGFVKHDLDQGEHEGHTLKNSLHTIIRVATDLNKRLSVQSEFPEWVSEKIGATKSMMVTVMDYLISSQEMQHDSNAMEGSDRQWSKKDMERLRVATRDFDDIMASDGPEAFKQELIKKRIQTKPMAGPKGVLPEGTQRVDSIVTDALRVMRGPEVSDAVLALKRVLGDRAYNERRGFYSFYVDQIHDMYGQQGVAEGELEEDLSRRGFLRGLGAAALGATALGAASKAQAGQGQNLGNGFVLTTVDVFGGKFKAVLDTQSDIHYIPNRNESGGAIVRSMAPFIMIKNGQTNTAMNVGPAAQAALKKAGLLKGVEEGMAEGEIDTSRMNKQHQDFYNRNPNCKRDDREATSVGGRLATKVTPKTAQVTKKPMTPFECKIDFAKKLQGKVDKHNKAVVKTKKDIGSRVADIGAGGKEHNEKTDAAWDAAKKKVSEGLKK